jgi:hypothetical protein
LDSFAKAHFVGKNAVNALKAPVLESLANSLKNNAPVHRETPTNSFPSIDRILVSQQTTLVGADHLNKKSLVLPSAGLYTN